MVYCNAYYEDVLICEGKKKKDSPWDIMKYGTIDNKHTSISRLLKTQGLLLLLLLLLLRLRCKVRTWVGVFMRAMWPSRDTQGRE